MNTISACLICKNEINNLGVLLTQDLLPVLEEVIVVDTGSTDGTFELLQNLATKHQNLKVSTFKWVDNFSAARNFSFSLGTQDWILFIDADDRVDANTLKHFKESVLDDPNVDAWLLEYVYSTHQDGSPQSTLSRERFLRRSKNPTWCGAIHEYVDINAMRQRNYAGLKIIHNRKGKTFEVGRNLRILEKEYVKNPNDARTAYYYGKELFDNIDNRGIEVLERYLQLPWKYWDDECNARARLSRAYLHLKRHGDAIRVANEIYHIDGSRDRAEFYWIYGAVEKDLRNYSRAIKWFELCLVTPPPVPRVLNLEYYNWNPLKNIAECYKELGNWNKAIEYADKVVALLPSDVEIGRWYTQFRGIVLQPKPGYSKVVLEYGLNIRHGSYVHGIDFDLSGALPFVDNCVDGVVASHPTTELLRVLKPGGFLWLEHNSELCGFGYLGKAEYRGESIFNYVKTDSAKPVLGFPSTAGDDSAQTRYRVLNLRLSAIKKAYPVVQDSPCDIYASTVLKNRFGKINILEVCERLPNYTSYGVELADVINCSSRLLAEHMKAMFPKKKVINTDDCFEMRERDWI